MSKTLSNILTVFKVVRIIAKVVFILCIIGGAGSLLTLISLPFVGSFLSDSSLLDEGISLPSTYLGCIIGIIACVGEAILAFLAERYFKNVLNAGTPFTFDSANESFRFGITSIIVSVATSLISGICYLATSLLSSPTPSETNFSASVSISVGLFFLFLSIIFKHGAELQKIVIEEARQSEETIEVDLP